MEYRHTHVVPAFPVPADLTVITPRVSSSLSAAW